MTSLNKRFSYLNRCTKCKHVSNDLQICGKCKWETYCSVDCQKQDWRTHKKVCIEGSHEITMGRCIIKEVLLLSSFLEFASRLCKEWANDHDHTLTATIFKSKDQTLPPRLRSINGAIPKLYDIVFTRADDVNDHFEAGELKIIMIYMSPSTKKCEFTSDLYINKEQADKLCSVNHMSDNPGFMKLKNANINDYIDKGFAIQVCIF
jgi:hypothetical protein